ncbi:MAG: hypothetical protein OXC27_04505 [Caldilineaceae bacterium]|nr:hypothetical protein [Caldilineaceae bacterium]
MFKIAVFVGLELPIAACVPIPEEPPAASLPPQAAGQRADCPGGYLDMLPGQSASDPMLSSLPGYIDIVGVDSSLEGETLTAIFYLREVPEELAFDREGVEDINLEYMWTVSINIEGNSLALFDQTDYSMAAFHAARRESADTPAILRPFKDEVEIMVWKHKHFPDKSETQLLEVPVNPRLIVSQEDNMLTLIDRIKGISNESTISFSTFDILLGQDGVSYRPS